MSVSKSLPYTVETERTFSIQYHRLGGMGDYPNPNPGIYHCKSYRNLSYGDQTRPLKAQDGVWGNDRGKVSFDSTQEHPHHALGYSLYSLEEAEENLDKLSTTRKRKTYAKSINPSTTTHPPQQQHFQNPHHQSINQPFAFHLSLYALTATATCL